MLSRVMRFTGNTVYADRGARTGEAQYLDDLTDAWYAVKAFDHIFCGEPKRGGSVDGLHFRGRYLQLQEAGEACRLPNYDRNEVVPGVIYTMGVRIEFPGGGSATHQTKGYGLTFTAEDILKVATRAFSENPTNSSSSTGCLLDVEDDDHQFTTVFVRRKAGIRTFYPDATPDRNRNGPCAAPIAVPAVAVSANRPPELVAAIPELQAPAGQFTELNLGEGVFTDPDGDALQFSATRADGTALPLWVDFDGARGLLMVLPETTQVGEQLRLHVVANDGQASASGDLTVSVVRLGAETIILDAAQNTEAAPLIKRLAAGDYRVEALGTDEGGTVTAWRAGDGQGWRTGYAIRSDEFSLKVLGTAGFDTPQDAFDAANPEMPIQLDRDQDVRFYIDGGSASGLEGGVSLRIVPE